MANENVLYERVLCGHMESMIRGLKKLPEDKWDWSPDVAAPTPRILALHAWQWLICDRYHIEDPDVDQHRPVPDPPETTEALIAAMEEENENWRRLLLGLTPEKLEEPRRQFGEGGPGNVRGFVGHMIQNVIYKNGQFTTLFFALGLDGKEPYDAPWPNPIYEEVRAAKRVESS